MLSMYQNPHSSAHTKMASKRKKEESLESLLERANQMLNPPKKRKAATFRHSYDPDTGRRNFKGTYRPKTATSSRSRRKARAEGGYRIIAATGTV